MGRITAASHSGRRTSRAARLAKKALSIRPRQAPGADALPQPGQAQGGRSGARGSGTPTRIDWPATLAHGQPRRRADLHWHARRLRDWPRLTTLPCPGLLLDIERAPIRLSRARQLAFELAADYHHIDELAPASRAPTWNRP